MEGLLSFGILCVGGHIHCPCHLCWNAFPIDPNTTSLGNGEWNCLSVVGHVTGDEKYECVIWNEFMKFSRMAFGSVYCESLRGSFLGVLYLYLWYSHATSVSNGWVGGSRLCGLFSAKWYWSHSHFSLVSGMVIKCRPVLS